MGEEARKTKQIVQPRIRDTELAIAIANVTVAHGHLDYALRMMIKSLTNADVHTAISATRKTLSGQLKREVRQLAKKRFGAGSAMLRVVDILERCEALTTKRNQLTHNLMAEETEEIEDEQGLVKVVGSGRVMVLNDDLEWVDVPTADEVESLHVRIRELVDEIHDARLHGWMAEALTATSGVEM